LVQSEPHSHTEYVHFEPSPVMVSLGSIKDFHVVRALSYFTRYHSLTLKSDSVSKLVISVVQYFIVKVKNTL
jgi:hypothetical protein